MEPCRYMATLLWVLWEPHIHHMITHTKCKTAMWQSEDKEANLALRTCEGRILPRTIHNDFLEEAMPMLRNEESPAKREGREEEQQSTKAKTLRWGKHEGWGCKEVKYSQRGWNERSKHWCLRKDSGGPAAMSFVPIPGALESQWQISLCLVFLKFTHFQCG